jgi:peptidoglycan/LPS O-acetylase OafA/YrhL
LRTGWPGPERPSCYSCRLRRIIRRVFGLYRPDIDGLRAVAVLSVVGFHALPGAFPGGFIGVDIFFVISGYLISNIVFAGLDEGKFSFKHFYSRRIKRIFPALMLVLFVCLVLGHFVLLADEYKQLGKHVSAGAGFVSNIALWTESGYFDNAAEQKPLLHLWSLGIEEQFYLFWPPLVFLAWKRRWVGGLLIALIGASFTINIAEVRHDPASAFYLPFSRMWELLIGCLLAYILRPSKVGRIARLFERKLAVNTASAVGFLSILVALFALDSKTSFPGWAALLPTAGALLMISAGADAWVNRQILSKRSVVFVGLISYPLYLWHWPLLAFARITLSTRAGDGTVAVIVLASFPLAWLTYRFIEKPIRSAKTLHASLPLAAIALILGSVGAYVNHSNGMMAPFRSLPIPKVVNRQAQPPLVSASRDQSPPVNNVQTQAAPAGPPEARGELNERVGQGTVKTALTPTLGDAKEGEALNARTRDLPKALAPQPPEETPEQIYAEQQSQFLWIENGDNATPECLAKFPMDAGDNKCEISDIHREPTVALLGDSHANAMYLGLARYYSSLGENLVNLGRGGCLPFWGVNTDDRRYPPTGCEKLMDRFLDYARTSTSIRTVILADYGLLYMDGGDRPIVSSADPSNKAATQVYERELKSTVARFLGAGKSVILAVDYPLPGIDTHACIKRPGADAPVITKCSVPQAQVDMRAAPYRQLMYRVLASLPPNVGYIDIAPAFCDGVDCWEMKGNLVLYRDGDHLSHDGSLYFSSAVKIQHFSTQPSQQ